MFPAILTFPEEVIVLFDLTSLVAPVWLSKFPNKTFPACIAKLLKKSAVNCEPKGMKLTDPEEEILASVLFESSSKPADLKVMSALEPVTRELALAPMFLASASRSMILPFEVNWMSPVDDKRSNSCGM